MAKLTEELLDIERASKSELLKEYERCEKDWSKFSCDSFGNYMTALHKKITSMGGWPVRK